MPDKKEIIRLLDEIGDMMEFNGENPFKVGAYRNGANAIRKSESDFDVLINSKRLDEIKGIGKGLQSVIYEYCEKGSSSLFEELKKDVPSGIGELLKVKGLGPKKLKLIYTELKISDLNELETAANDGRLAKLKGFTQFACEKILEEIARIRVSSKYILLNRGITNKEEIISRLNKVKHVLKIEAVGELKRLMEIFSVLEFLILTDDESALLEEIGKIYNLKIDDETILVEDIYDIPVKFYLTSDKKNFYRKLIELTGSAQFVKSYFNDLKTAANEEEIFLKSGKEYVNPEMREDEYLSVSNKKLLTNSDLDFNKFKGMLHWHTTYSDGRAKLEDMLNEAEKLGFEYIAVCDHSKSAFYAQGLTENRVFEQTEHLKKLKKKYKLKLFQGIESDILQDGSLDYSEDFLKNFDFVVASVHSRFNMDEKEMTRRLIKAVENPNTDVIGHISGRLLLAREPYKFEVYKVLDACIANRVAIEINASPRRLDLDWRFLYYVRDKGAVITINADAHSVEEIYLHKYGVMMGRKAGVMAEEVLNCYKLSEFEKFLNRKTKRKFVV